jgi:hypothetical protein
VTEPYVKPKPIPSAELLLAADCAPALSTYRQLLLVPSRRGAVVTNRVTTTRSEEEQARAAQAFADQCQTRLVGHVRRIIVNCWRDAPDIETFQTCSQRF